MSPAEALAINLVTFDVSGRRFAIHVAAVRHVVRATAISLLPDAPTIIEGIINVHGTVVPVIALGARFGFEQQALHPEQHFLIAQAGPRDVALRVDRVLDLVSVPAVAIEPIERSAPGAPHVAGVARLPEGVLIIQDLDQVLSLDEGAALDAALNAR